MKTKKILYAIPFIFLIFFIILTILLICTIDYMETIDFVKKTGLIHLNGAFPYFEYNRILDKVSDAFMVIGVLIMLIMAGIGLYQLIKRRSIKKVDSDILLFGGIVLLMIVVWIIFERCPISYRPHSSASSYPSTHVMVVTTTFFIFSWMINKRLHRVWGTITTYLISSIAVVVTFILRMTSGMHWFTDCLGGVCIGFLFASTLISLDIAIKDKIK